MNTFRAIGVSAVLMLLAVTLAVPARAGFIQDLSTSFGTGQITFDALSGDLPNVVDFSFDVSTGFRGGPQTYGLADIDTINYSIVDWDLTMNLVTFLKPLGADMSGITLVNDGVATAPPCGGPADPEASTCESLASGTNGGSFSALTTMAVHVGEPAAVPMFAAGIAFILWLGRRLGFRGIRPVRAIASGR